MKKNNIREHEKAFAEWLHKNGACKVDFKNQDIILYDGGLFSIKDTKWRAKKFTGRFKTIHHKKFGKCYEMIIYKNKYEWHTSHDAEFYFSDLHENINYLKRLEKFLIKLGYKTTLRRSKKIILK
jgi:hypothetical protein